MSAVSLDGNKPALRVPSRRRVIRLLGGALLGGFGLLALQGALTSQLRIGIDPDSERCFPWTVYLMRETFYPSAIKPGALVRFDPGARMSIPGTGPINKGRQVIKMVAATSGDRVRISPEVVTINAIPLKTIVHRGIGQALETDGLNRDVLAKLGRVASDLERSFIVPEGHVFVVATASRSFDSRYWGTLPASAITALATPIY